MSERDPSPAAPRAQAPPSADRRDSTTPPDPAAGGAPYSGAGEGTVGAGGVGKEGEDGRGGTGAHGYAEQSENYYTTPQYSTSPVKVRRPDVLATLLLVLAGIAAAASLLLDWVRRSTGWDLVSRGFEGFGTGTWQPPVIVLAGGGLLALGLLMMLPARTHRTLGVLALLVTMAGAGGVLVMLNIWGFDWSDFRTGFWLAVAVPVLGLLGSLKAMLTGPKVR